jgi:hypothetical protein
VVKEMQIEPIERDIEVNSFFNTDPLLISCIQYRHYNADPKKITVNFYQPEQVSQILALKKPEDDILVSNIKQYYYRKYILCELKNGSLTEYKKNVLSLFECKDYNKIPSNYLGIIFKLPFFYHYDKEIDKMFGEHQPKYEFELKFKEFLNLTFIKTLIPYPNNFFAVKQYWFKDNNNTLFLYKSKQFEPFLSLFEEMIEKRGKIKIRETSNIKKRSYYNYNYYELIIPNIIYE